MYVLLIFSSILILCANGGLTVKCPETPSKWCETKEIAQACNDYKILISGLSTLEEELTWFENKLKEKNINIEDIKPLPANLNYQNWINELISSKKSYLSLITTYYAIEICYYQAWKSVKNRDYQEYADRWGSKEFEQYIDQLRVSVDNASITASDDDKNDASHLWNTIMEFEIDFWNMAINETS
ncbi:unnamed protein product [Adineta steineri]|uniref:Thiaminase-2/PQQC domain-containing protein n=1 Tax=Adineta steineri TaxID=433720 RepID=A0A814WI49_9BILA|nr:unnamed protein product [Adineta steineri]